MNDIMDLHTHTIASGHAYNTLYEMVRSASEKGLKLFGCSDHAPSVPGACHEFHFVNFKVIPRDLYGIKILMGCELNIMNYDGKIDLKNRYLNRLDYTIASIHEVCYHSGSIKENTSAYLGAIKNPSVNIIGHPDDGRFPVEYEPIVEAALKYNKLLEVNNSSLHPQSPRPNARENYLKMLELCKQYKVSVIINSDAHIESDVGNHKRAHALLEELSFPEKLIVNTSMEKLIPFIPKLQEYLQAGDQT